MAFLVGPLEVQLAVSISALFSKGVLMNDQRNVLQAAISKKNIYSREYNTCQQKTLDMQRGFYAYLLYIFFTTIYSNYKILVRRQSQKMFSSQPFRGSPEITCVKGDDLNCIFCVCSEKGNGK